MSAITQAEAQAFLFREARLMDGSAYRKWLELWDEDAIYWVPCNAGGPYPRRAISLIYADRAQLEDRVARLESGTAYAQEPVSITSRVVSNIELDPSDAGVDGVESVVHSTFNLTELRRGEQHTFAGRSRHVLRRVEDGIRMTSKKVVLVNRDEFIANLTFLV
jgi:3-phenylpropionate/cinnamic acid dioxygenase small subunit